MRLGQLMASLDDVLLLHGDLETEVVTVELDSRLVEPGSLFCCVVGSSDDGHEHVAEAIARGAVGIVTERDVEAARTASIAELRVPSGHARHACAALSSAISGRPAERLTMIGVTGTNGKTTVVSMLASILERSGFATTVIGTLTGSRTTPPAPVLHRLLADAASFAQSMGQPGAVAMEVSSHALDQERVTGVHFAVAIFTNLSHDHLDYHGTMEAYFQAKARLFDDDVAACAVVWIETPEGQTLLNGRRGSSVAVGWSDAQGLVVGPHGSSYRWRDLPVQLPLLGRPNVIDALLASEAAVSLGVEPTTVVDALGELEPVPGRMEVIPGGETAPLVLVDYAHTPDALEGALRAVRPMATGEVVVVFGCGGDRDAEKRPVMGSVASELADRVVITTDNPRHEAPATIAQAIVAGATGPARVLEISSRDLAIRAAIEDARAGDVVLIAGKGHETTQDFADESLPFDDRAAALSALTERARKR